MRSFAGSKEPWRGKQTPGGARTRRATLGARLCVIASVALLVGLPKSALGYCRSAACIPAGIGDVCSPIDPLRESPDCIVPLFWPERCLGYSIQRDGSRSVPPELAAELVERAFETWTSADCGGSRPSVVARRQPDVRCSAPEYNLHGGNANVIMFRDDGWPYPYALEALGLATLTYDVETGEIFDVDIELNTTDFAFTTSDTDVEFDLASTLQHETGHFFGISHSSFVDATMYATPNEGSIAGRELSSDDVDAICAQYPPDDGEVAAHCDPLPHRFSAACGEDQRADSRDESRGGGCTLARRAPAPGSAALALAWLAAAAFIARRSARARSM